MVESIYLMPGMGANPKIFEFLDLPINFKLNFSHGFHREIMKPSIIILKECVKELSTKSSANRCIFWGCFGSGNGKAH